MNTLKKMVNERCHDYEVMKSCVDTLLFFDRMNLTKRSVIKDDIILQLEGLQEIIELANLLKTKYKIYADFKGVKLWILITA